MDSDIESSTPNDSPNPKHQQRRLSGIVNSDTKSEHSVSGSGMQVSAYHMKSFAPHAMWIHVAALHRVYVTIILLEYIWKSISRYYRRRVRFLFFFFVIFNIHLYEDLQLLCHSLLPFTKATESNNRKNANWCSQYSLLQSTSAAYHCHPLELFSFFAERVARKKKCVKMSFGCMAAAYSTIKVNSHFSKQTKRKKNEFLLECIRIRESTEEIINVSVEHIFSAFSLSSSSTFANNSMINSIVSIYFLWKRETETNAKMRTYIYSNDCRQWNVSVVLDSK